MLFIVVGSVGIDILTKNLAEKELLLSASKQDPREYVGRTVPVASFGEASSFQTLQGSYLGFSFTYVRNQGAAWGMLSDMDDRVRDPFFYLVTFLALLLIGYYLWTTPVSHRLIRFSFILILSGALGNVADRIRQGYVIDFLDVHWVLPLNIDWKVTFFPKFLDFLNFHLVLPSWAYEFPKFNWADSMITTGVILLLLDMLFVEPKRLRRKSLEAEASG